MEGMTLEQALAVYGAEPRGGEVGELTAEEAKSVLARGIGESPAA